MTNKAFAARAIAGLLLGLLAAPAARAADEELDRERERGNQLESQIQSELERQEELLERMRAEDAARKEAARPGKKRPSDARDLEQRADPRIAPSAPEERELPLAIFDQTQADDRGGRLGQSARELDVVAHSLDADEDGRARAGPLLRRGERGAAAHGARPRLQRQARRLAGLRVAACSCAARSTRTATASPTPGSSTATGA